MIAVDHHLQTDEVCKQLGYFVRFNCARDEIEQSPASQSTPKNGFEVMMEAQRNISYSNQLPARLTPRSKKDQLFNDTVTFFEKKGCDGGNSHGKNFISMLQEILWYIDGHQKTKERHSCTIASEWQSFNGYNFLEKSKCLKWHT